MFLQRLDFSLEVGDRGRTSGLHGHGRDLRADGGVHAGLKVGCVERLLDSRRGLLRNVDVDDVRGGNLRSGRHDSTANTTDGDGRGGGRGPNRVRSGARGGRDRKISRRTGEKAASRRRDGDLNERLGDARGRRDSRLDISRGDGARERLLALDFVLGHDDVLGRVCARLGVRVAERRLHERLGRLGFVFRGDVRGDLDGGLRREIDGGRAQGKVDFDGGENSISL